MENKNREQMSLYESKHYFVLSDRVVQHNFQAKALNRNHIISNYQSPARTNYSSLITFKFCINGKDNEATSGMDHQVVVRPKNGKYTSPTITFGKTVRESFTDGVSRYLEPNILFTVRLDMRDVLKQFNEKGYFTTYQGDHIQASDFKGVYIAGGSAPLSWDFDNLDRKPEFQLLDKDGDGIYEVTLILNPHDPNEKIVNEWRLRNDISKYPAYESDQLLIDALFNMSLDETAMLIEEDGTFRTGAEWSGVWTRDISYSVLLVYGFLEPEVSKTSLMRKVKRDRIVQDTGSGGAWPVSTDRVVWSLAAWEIYLATGDAEWLKNAYRIIKNTIEDDLLTVRDKTGLFKGESSFLDWREQTYPAWMDNVDISQSLNLGTNMVYYRTLLILSEMALLLDREKDANRYGQLAKEVKEAINTNFLNHEKGYYNQYLYGRHFMVASERSETLGEAFGVLFGVADKNTAQTIVENTPMTPYGAPCIYPQIPNIAPYHNNGIWPFVQAYWNWAAKVTNNEKALTHGLASLYRAAALFLTNKENFMAENGDFMGTQFNSDRQLWSVAGNLAMVFRVFLGLNFRWDKIVIQPFVPKSLKGTRRLSGFKYRNATLDFELHGFGNQIEGMTIDGAETDVFEVPGYLSGHHKIVIKLNNKTSDRQNLNLVKNEFSLPHPEVSLIDRALQWNKVDSAETYQIMRNGQLLQETSENRYAIPKNQFGLYSILAKNNNGVLSFASEPIEWYSFDDVKVVEAENFASVGTSDLLKYSGKGFVEISKTKNTEIHVPIQINLGGKYLIYFRYSNGSGPLHTDNKCAIRTLKLNGNKAGTVVMAQRGEGEWSNWGYTNPIYLELSKGNHSLQLVLEPYNENMNMDINDAMIDHVKIVRISE